MKGRKPNGKENIFKNGDVFEGEYVKGKREGYGIYMFPTEKSTKDSGSRTSSTEKVSIFYE
jgi:hypothetical protein